MMYNVLFLLKLRSTCSNVSKCVLAQNMVRMYQEYIYVSDNQITHTAQGCVYNESMNVSACPGVFTDHYIGSVFHD